MYVFFLPLGKNAGIARKYVIQFCGSNLLVLFIVFLHEFFDKQAVKLCTTAAYQQIPLGILVRAQKPNYSELWALCNSIPILSPQLIPIFTTPLSFWTKGDGPSDLFACLTSTSQFVFQTDETFISFITLASRECDFYTD